MLLLPRLVLYVVSFMQIQAAVVTETHELSGQCGKSWSLFHVVFHSLLFY